MKFSKIVLALAVGALLSACGQTPASSSSEGGNSAASSSASSEAGTSSSSSSSSASTDSGGSSSSDSQTEEQVTIQEILQLVAKAKEKASLISSGTVTLNKNSLYEGLTSQEMPFEFGTDSNGDTLHYVGFDYDGRKDNYLIKDEKGAIVPITKDSTGKISKPWGTFTEVAFPFENPISSGNIMGTEGFLSYLLEKANSNVNKDLKVSSKDGVYSASFGYFESLDTWTFYKVEVSFSIGTQNEIKTAKIKVDEYPKASFIVDDELGVITLLEGASVNSSKEYVISQTTGEKTFVNPYKLEDFYATSFDLRYNETALTSASNVQMEVEGNASVKIENILPATASFAFDEIQISVTEGTEGGLSAFYDSYNNQISINASSVGTYLVTVWTKKVTKTFNVVVTTAQPKSISLSYVIDGVSPSGYDSFVYEPGQAIQAYKEVTYYLQASVMPNAANQSLVASVKDKEASTYTLEKKSIKVSTMPDAEAKEVFCFTPNVTGTFAVTISSTVKPEVQEVVNFNVVENPSIKEVLSSEYGQKMGNNVSPRLTFTPSEDGLSGKVKIVKGSQTETCAYTLTKGAKYYSFALTHESGETFNYSLKMNFAYELYLFTEGDSWGNQLFKVTPELLVQGDWTGTGGAYTLNISLMMGNNASLSIMKTGEFNSSYMQVSYSLVESGDGYTGSFTANSYTEDQFTTLPLSFTVNKDYTTLSVSFTYEGTALTFALAKADY